MDIFEKLKGMAETPEPAKVAEEAPVKPAPTVEVVERPVVKRAAVIDTERSSLIEDMKKIAFGLNDDVLVDVEGVEALRRALSNAEARN